MKKGIGIILEGGGVKGAYHVGALKAIQETKIKITGYAGTSIGALNAAQLCQTDIDTLYDIWDKVVTTTIYDVDQELIDSYKKHGFTFKFIREALKYSKQFSNYYSGTQRNMYDFIHGHLDEEKLRASKKDLGFVTYCISTRRGLELMKEDCPKGTLIDFVEASAAFPAFPAKEIEGKKYIDGGVWDNMPINLFARHGYDKMIVIRTGNKKPKKKLEKEDLKLLYITPKEDLGKVMAFDREIIHKDMELGYKDMLEAINNGGLDIFE